jgi:hypothetical protein
VLLTHVSMGEAILNGVSWTDGSICAEGSIGTCD